MNRFQRLLNATDPELAAHGRRAGLLSRDIALAMRIDEARLSHLEIAAEIHDVGKIFISRDILDKPGPLDAGEWDELRRHPMMGYQLVRGTVPESVARIVLTHHEWYDGTGYPFGITGKKIPLEARILQVADAFDAITSERPYQPALPVEYALNEMVRCSGGQFDPTVVEAIVELAGRSKWVRRRFGLEDQIIDEIAV